MRRSLILSFFILILPLSDCLSQDHLGRNSKYNSKSYDYDLKDQNDSSKTPLQITGGGYEIGFGYFDTFVALGVGVHLNLFEPFIFGVRSSIDFRDGSIFVFPFLGCTWKGIGGFEIGKIYRPDYAEWKVPYYEVWRVWMGNEKIFYLSASVLSNTPLLTVGYYEIGVGFGFGKNDNRIWCGVTSINSKKPEGPGIKTQWQAGDNSWLLINGSYIFKQSEGDIRFTLSVGWKQEF